MMRLRAILDWANLKDYEDAKERATNDIVEQLTRGNTSAQDGFSMEEADLTAMSTCADYAMSALEKRLPH